MAEFINENQIKNNIIAAFDKIMTIYRFTLWDIGKVENLSPIQIQFIEFIDDNPQNLCTLTNLSIEFELSKPTVSDSINNLEKKGFILKLSDNEDARISYIKLTEKSNGILTTLKSRKNLLSSIIDNATTEDKIRISSFLSKIIYEFHHEGVIQSARMCQTCFNFVKNANPVSDTPHYCSFAKIYMAEPEMRTYCPVHKNK
jgi:DNA-binding MarR family transcriptional regulator